MIYNRIYIHVYILYFEQQMPVAIKGLVSGCYDVFGNKQALLESNNLLRNISISYMMIYHDLNTN